MQLTASEPSTSQVPDTFLLFGSACLLFVATLRLFDGSAPEEILTGAGMAVPLAILLAGSRVQRRLVRAICGVESRLREVAARSDPAGLNPRTIDETHPVAIGWNRIVNSLAESSPLDHLEERLRPALEALKQQKFQLVLHTLADGIAVTDVDGQITFANRSLAAQLGMNDETSLVGRRMEELLPSAERGSATGPGVPGESPAGASQHSDTGRVPSGCSGNLPRPLVRPLVFEFHPSEEMGAEAAPAGMVQGVLRVERQPLLRADGKPGGHVWSVRDVTQQKLSEEMRNQFVFSATHELRTPLANIKAYAESLLLDDDIDIEQQKDFCNIINSEATRLSRFVDELLDINQMEAGSLSLSRHETDIERLAAEVAEKVQPQMIQKQIEFQMQLPPKLPKLRIDKDKISAALVNLLGNAAKYTPEGGRVEFSADAGSDGEIRFHVEDTGIGISPEELPKVSDKFFRSADPRVRDVSGSGLGLSFAQEVVRLHGGKLSVHSELNKGTKFSMILPIV